MKLHEKILTHYLSCPSPVDKEGYLYKKVRRKHSQRENTSFYIHPPQQSAAVSAERAKCYVPAALVRPEGQPALLPGAPGRPTPAGGHRAGGVCRTTRRVGRTVHLLPGVRRSRTEELHLGGGGQPDSGELGENSAVSQPLLPVPPAEGSEGPVRRCVTHLCK